MTDNEIKNNLAALAEFCRKCGNLEKEKDVLNNALDLINRQQAAIKELIDYIIDIENYHEERLERLQSLTNISFSAEEGV